MKKSKKHENKMKIVLFVLLAVHIQANDMSSLLFNGNCITCHKETKTISAPSVVEFKKNYKDAFSTKEDFVKFMTAFVLNPTKEKSIMQGSIKKHGLMPHLCYDEEMLKDISSYIYETDFKTRGGRYWNK